MLHAFLRTAKTQCPLPTSLPAGWYCNTSPFSQTWQGQHLFFPSLAQWLQHLSKMWEAGVTSFLCLKGVVPVGAPITHFPGD